MKTEETQPKHPALALIAARPDLFARQGSINPTWRQRNGITFGPYYRLSYRDHGRQCVIYLGRDGPLVQHVRHLLEKNQKPLRQKRIFDRIERETRSALRANNARLAMLLRPLGLRLKGFEVRGWRTSPLRVWLPHRASIRRPGHLAAQGTVPNFCLSKNGTVPLGRCIARPAPMTHNLVQARTQTVPECVGIC